MNPQDLSQMIAAAVSQAVAQAFATANTAPAAPAPEETPTVSPAAPAQSQAAAPVDGADAYAAFRTAYGVPLSVWNAQAPKASPARAAVKAAYVGGFDRKANKGDRARASLAFGANGPAMQAHAAALLKAHGVAAPVETVAAHVAQTAPETAPEVAPLTLPGIETAAPVKPRKARQQAAGTVALNGARVYATANGLPSPRNGADVDAMIAPGTYAALRDFVTAQRAAGNVVTADGIAHAIANAVARSGR